MFDNLFKINFSTTNKGAFQHSEYVVSKKVAELHSDWPNILGARALVKGHRNLNAFYPITSGWPIKRRATLEKCSVP